MFERGHAVHTDAENLCFRVGEFGDISLIRLDLLRSAAGEGQHVEGQHDVLLAFELAQRICLAVGGRQ